MLAETKCAPADLSLAMDSVLIDLTLKGNHDAYAQLVSRYQDRLFASMLRIAQSAELAEEIVHLAFVQAYLKLDTFRRHSAFSTWLFRIAFNKMLSMKRATRATTSPPRFEDGRERESVDPGDSPERECIRAEERQSLHDALARLDTNSRTILVLRELNEMSYEEISEVLKIKLGTVRSKLSRARCKLLHELRICEK